MKEKICCFTGHREIDKELLPYLPEVLGSILQKILVFGITTFRAGGARGFDNFAAQMVMRLKVDHPDIKLKLCLPCPDQAAKWHPSDKEIYRRIINACDGYTYAAPRYERGCMHERNRQLVDGSDFCIAYYDSGKSGGTAYTVKYAESRGVLVINIYPLVREAKRIHDAKNFSK